MYIFKQYFRSFKTFIKSLFLMLVLALLIFPNVVSAGVHITEIMYDLIGADAGREWIEVYNTNSEDVDLSTYRFLENNVNHRIRIYDPDNEGLTNILPAGEYAVIADGPAKFMVDNMNFSGLLFNSSFSLRDGGEELSMVNPDGEIIYSVHYLPEWGARATGNSLQFNGEKWIPAVPTPGKPNATEAVDESNDDSDNQEDDSSSSGQTSSQTSSQNNQTNPNNNSESSHSGQNPLSNFARKIDLEVGSGRIRYGIINSPIDFQAISNFVQISKLEDESGSLRTPRFNWSFGDAGNSRGEKTTHTYYHEGEYNLVLNADYSNQSATSRNKIIIRKPEIQVSLTTSGKLVDILLENKSDFEVNFGLFYFINYQLNGIHGEEQLKMSQNRHIIPRDTILDANSKIKIAGELSNFQADNTEGIVMYYPNGKPVANFLKSNNPETDFILSKPENLEKLLQIIKNISEDSKHQELKMIFDVFKNRLKAENRL